MTLEGNGVHYIDEYEVIIDGVDNKHGENEGK
jgi:hypothetical protein